MSRYFKTAKHYARLNLLTLPRQDRRDILTFNRGNKRELAEQLIAMFQDGSKNPDHYNFKGIDLSGADLRGLNLRILGSKALRTINFARANLSGQNFRGLNLRGMYAPGAFLTDARFDNANLENANFEKAQGGRVSFFGASAIGINMNHAKLIGCNWQGDFRGAKIAMANISYGYIGEGTSFENAKMRGVNMSHMVHVNGEPNFRAAEMQQATLRGDFTNSNFAGADLTEAKLEGGKFTNVNFVGAITATTHTGITNKYAALKLAEAPMPTAPAPDISYCRQNLQQLQYAA